MIHMGLTALFLLLIRLSYLIFAAALMIIIMYAARIAFISIAIRFWHQRSRCGYIDRGGRNLRHDHRGRDDLIHRTGFSPL
jgi:hypothetical protein